MMSLIVRDTSVRQRSPAAYNRKMNFIGRNNNIRAGRSSPAKYPASIAVLYGG